jgi:hypothetical protein
VGTSSPERQTRSRGYANPGAVLARYGFPVVHHTSQNCCLYQDGIFPTENVRSHGWPLPSVMRFSFAVCIIAVVISCKEITLPQSHPLSLYRAQTLQLVSLCPQPEGKRLLPLTSRLFSKLPCSSTLNRPGRTSSTIHVPPCSTIATPPTPSLLYLKSKLELLMNSGTAIPNWSSGLSHWSIVCTLSAPRRLPVWALISPAQ